MKQIISILSFILLSNLIFSQQKVKFKDDTSIEIQGKLIGVKTEIQDGKENKKVYYYYLRKDNNITVSIYGLWTMGRMDYLTIYNFKMDQLNKDNFSEIREREADEYNVNNYFSLSFSTDTETPFNYSTYNLYSSVPENKSFSIFSIESEDKNALQLVFDDIVKQFHSEEEVGE